MVLLAGTAVLTVDVLDLHRPMLAGAAALMMVCFPAVGSTCTYIYTMDGYMLALFLSVLAVWCMERLSLIHISFEQGPNALFSGFSAP